jgi:hypothetical protein
MQTKSIKLAGLLLATAFVMPMMSGAAFADEGLSARQRAELGRDNMNEETRRQIVEDARRPMPRAANSFARLLNWHSIMMEANAVDHTAVVSTGAALEQGGPVRNARAFAMVSIAVFDAVQAFKKEYRQRIYLGTAPRGASIDAAITYAAYGVLSNLHTSQLANLNTQLNADLANINASAASIAAGKAIGDAAAAAVIANRANDGSNVGNGGSMNFGTGGLVSGTSPAGFERQVNRGVTGQTAAEQWDRDPVGRAPNGAIRNIALGANWGAVRPFVTLNGAQFRAPPPPADGSARYLAGFNEVKAIGSSTGATARNQFVGNFWGYDGAPFLGTPPRLYNQIARQIALDNGINDVSEMSRLLAVVNSGMADSGVGAWDSKYFYDYARPVTGVRRGNDDGNAATVGQADWEPFGASVINGHAERFTPPFPAYVSGHATFGASMFETMRSYFGNNTRFTFTSDEYNGGIGRPAQDPGKTFITPGQANTNTVTTRPLVPVRYRTLLEAQQENGRSRVYNGVHWEWDDNEGQAMGVKISRYTRANAFQRLGEREDENDDD